MMRKLPIYLAPVILIPGIALAEECKDINFTLDTDNVRRLELDADAGFLNVTGTDNPGARIDVQAQACADSASDLEDMDVLYERRGDTWVLEAYIPDRNFNLFSLFDVSGSRRIDIDMQVPSGLDLDIDDGSGDIHISHIAGELRLDDGSGDITLSDIAGPVELDDGSGDVDMQNIGGAISIEDGSGAMVLNQVHDVTVEDDGSGNIHITDAEGYVRVEDDGSGDIRIENVAGDVRIDDDGSGDIDVRGIRGEFTTGNTGSGDVDYRER